MDGHMHKYHALASALVAREQHGLESRFVGAAANSKSLWQRMAMDTKNGLLQGHKGCVNHVQFNETGTLLASGSDDARICLWDLQSSSPVVTLPTGHKSNIFCVKFMPGTGDSSQPLLASCAGDAEVRLHDVDSGKRSVFNHHGSRVKKLVTEPGNPHLVISCSEDGTVRQLDVREAGGGQRQLLQLARNGVKLEINSISSPWHKPWLLAVGASDDALRVYDRRMGSSSGSSASRRAGPRCVSHFTPALSAAGPGSSIGSNCITGVAFADDGQQVLANYLGGYVYLWTVSGTTAKALNSAAQQPETSAPTRRGKRSRQAVAAAAAPAAAAAAAPSTTTAAAAAAAAEHEADMQPRKLAPAGSSSGGAAHAAATAGAGADAGAGAGAAHAEEMQMDENHHQQQHLQEVEEDEQGEVGHGAAGAPTGQPRCMLSVDDAVALIQRGELIVPRRRRGVLASMVLNRSQDLYEHGEVDVSLRYARTALQLRPSYGMAHYQAAICLEAQGQPGAALAEGEAALQLAWGYDLQAFVRRLSRSVSAAAAATGGGGGGAAGGSEQAAGGIGSGGQQDAQQQQHREAAATVRPLPPLLQQRLAVRGILPAAEALAGARGVPGATSSAAAAAAAAAAAGGQIADAVVAGAEQDAVDVFAAAAAAASGGSESWSPSFSSSADGGGGGGSTEEAATSSSSRGSGSGSEAPSGMETDDSSSGSDSGIGSELFDDLSELSSNGIGSSGSSSSGDSSSSSSSDDSDRLDSSISGDHEMEFADDESGDEWLSEDMDMEGGLGLDARRWLYDWGGDLQQQQPQQQQQQQGPGVAAEAQANVAAAAGAGVGEDDDSQRFSEFLAPLRRQLVLLQVRQQRRLLEQQQHGRQQQAAQDAQQQQQQQQGQAQHGQPQQPQPQQQQQQQQQQDPQHQQHAQMDQLLRQQQQSERDLRLLHFMSTELQRRQAEPHNAPMAPHLQRLQQEVQQQFDVAHERCRAAAEQAREQQQQQQQAVGAGSGLGRALQSEHVEQAAAAGAHRTGRSSGREVQVHRQAADQLLLLQQQQPPDAEHDSGEDEDASGVSSDDHDSDGDDDGDGALVAEEDLLTERDPLILELGRILAAGDFGASSSSSTNAGDNTAEGTAAAAVAEPRVGLADLDAAAAAGDATGLGLSGSRQHRWTCRYRGHLNIKTVKDVSFVGPSQGMVAAGSDDGRLFIWDRDTGALVTCLRGDRYVVNCCDSHPSLPLMASCGIDSTIKLWSPCLSSPRPLSDALLFCMGYNELQRAAEGCALYTGFSDMCRAFSRQRAEQLVQQYRAEQQLATAGL